MENHNCEPVSVSTYDGISLEKVCLDCGQVFPIEEAPIDKLDRCYDLESFMNVRYGPATAQGLQSFLLPMPTDKRLKVHDQFVDIDILNTLRAYTNLLRIAEQCSIPKILADEAMRSLLRTGKGLFSDHQQVNALRRVVHVAMFQRSNIMHMITALAYYEDTVLESRKEVKVNPERMTVSIAKEVIKI